MRHRQGAGPVPPWGGPARRSRCQHPLRHRIGSAPAGFSTDPLSRGKRLTGCGAQGLHAQPGSRPSGKGRRNPVSAATAAGLEPARYPAHASAPRGGREAAGPELEPAEGAALRAHRDEGFGEGVETGSDPGWGGLSPSGSLGVQDPEEQSGREPGPHGARRSPRRAPRTPEVGGQGRGPPSSRTTRLGHGAGARRAHRAEVNRLRDPVRMRNPQARECECGSRAPPGDLPGIPGSRAGGAATGPRCPRPQPFGRGHLRVRGAVVPEEALPVVAPTAVTQALRAEIPTLVPRWVPSRPLALKPQGTPESLAQGGVPEGGRSRGAQEPAPRAGAHLPPHRSRTVLRFPGLRVLFKMETATTITPSLPCPDEGDGPGAV